MQIVDWQCHFTAHQSSTWQELERLYPDKVMHIVARMDSEQRSEQGWKTLDPGDMDVTHLKKRGWFRQGLGILRENGDAIHVFGGFWADRRFLPLIVYAVMRGIRVAVMNEGYATEAVGYLSDTSYAANRIRLMLRPLAYRAIAILLRMVARSNRLCILALSKHAEAQFVKAGFTPDQVFPFGYFVPRQALEIKRKHCPQGEPLRLIYVGSLLERKGVDLAVQAVETLAGSVPVTLDVYGHGDVERYIPSDAKAIAYKGVIPFGKAQQVIAGYDALLLPSRHDGWGVVVNEALLQGVPVIASNHVGAKCLIEASGAGMVFKSGDADALQDALARFAADRAMQLDMRQKAERVAGLITPERAAGYMRDVLMHAFSRGCDRPKELWCDPSSTR